MRRLLPASTIVFVLSGAACAVSVDQQGYIEHQEQRFPAASTVELHLTTFNGAIEVRAWDRPEIVIDVEKRAEDKTAVDRIKVNVERNGDRVTLEAVDPDAHHPSLGLFVNSRVRFVASVPKQTNLVIQTSDGAVSVERVSGRIDLRTSDGGVRAVDTEGTLNANTSDGTIELDNVSGQIDVQTSDGSLRISGAPTALHARTDDGAVVLRVRAGATVAEDWLVSTEDGSVSVELPAALDAELDADPGDDGHVRNRLTTLTNVTGGTHDEPHLRGRLGAGGHRVTIRTSDGTITLSAGG
jgi:hypothetical protein